MQKRNWALLTGGLLAAIVIGYLATRIEPAAQARAGAADDAKPVTRQADEEALRQLGAEFVSDFDKGDAAAIAALYTAEGELTHNDGEVMRGRAEIQKAYANYFKNMSGKKKLDIHVDSTRFPSADTVIVEATLRLKNEDNEIVASSWRSSLLVREGGKWLVAVTREFDRDVSEDTTLKEVEWLIGAWQASSQDREVTITYEWDENKAFIRGKYSIKEAGKVIESGTQMIGKDNADGVIRSWAFQSDGGFGGGVWARDGKKWSVDVSSTTADGRELTATNIYIHLDANTYSWQSVNRKLSGEPAPDTPIVKVTRQKAGN